MAGGGGRMEERRGGLEGGEGKGVQGGGGCRGSCPAAHVTVCVYVCVCVCVRARVCGRARARARACCHGVLCVCLCCRRGRAGGRLPRALDAVGAAPGPQVTAAAAPQGPGGDEMTRTAAVRPRPTAKDRSAAAAAGRASRLIQVITAAVMMMIGRPGLLGRRGRLGGVVSRETFRPRRRRPG